MPKGAPPPQRKPDSDDQYLEEITQAVFRSGFSWQVVENKWPNFQKAFANFSVEAVADFDERDVERLPADAGIVRNGRKIEATIKNARTMKALRDEHGTFHAYLRSLDGVRAKIQGAAETLQPPRSNGHVHLPVVRGGASPGVGGPLRALLRIEMPFKACRLENHGFSMKGLAPLRCCGRQGALREVPIRLGKRS